MVASECLCFIWICVELTPTQAIDGSQHSSNSSWSGEGRSSSCRLSNVGIHKPPIYSGHHRQSPPIPASHARERDRNGAPGDIRSR